MTVRGALEADFWSEDKAKKKVQLMVYSQFLGVIWMVVFELSFLSAVEKLSQL